MVNRGNGYETLKHLKSESNVVAIDVELTMKVHNLLFSLRTGLQIIQKFGFINGVDNVNWPPYRDSKS